MLNHIVCAKRIRNLCSSHRLGNQLCKHLTSSEDSRLNHFCEFLQHQHVSNVNGNVDKVKVRAQWFRCAWRLMLTMNTETFFPPKNVIASSESGNHFKRPIPYNLHHRLQRRLGKLAIASEVMINNSNNSNARPPWWCEVRVTLKSFEFLIGILTYQLSEICNKLNNCSERQVPTSYKRGATCVNLNGKTFLRFTDKSKW